MKSPRAVYGRRDNANSEVLFEVEIRCHFDSQQEVYNALPFVRSYLQREVSWAGTFYGLKLFKLGQVLRVSDDVVPGEGAKCFLGWKGPDVGKLANIREELEEEITTGIVDSAIVKRLGGKARIGSRNEIVQELERLGHHRFMAYEGTSLVGHYEPLGIKVKLINCPVLRWPFLLEIEKMANTEKEAIRCEIDLYELSRRFQLQSRLVREEPPTLLYAGLFTHESRAG